MATTGRGRRGPYLSPEGMCEWLRMGLGCWVFCVEHTLAFWIGLFEVANGRPGWLKLSHRARPPVKCTGGLADAETHDRWLSRRGLGIGEPEVKLLEVMV